MERARIQIRKHRRTGPHFNGILCEHQVSHIVDESPFNLFNAPCRDNEVYISTASDIRKLVVDLHATTFKTEWQVDFNGHVSDLICYLDHVVCAAQNSIRK